MLKILPTFFVLLLFSMALVIYIDNKITTDIKNAARALTPQAAAICHSRHQTFYKIYHATAEPAVLCTGAHRIIYTYPFTLATPNGQR